MRTAALTASAIVLVAAPSISQAQTPPVPSPPGVKQIKKKPQPPARGHMRLVMERVFHLGSTRIDFTGRTLRVRGLVSPYKPGQRVRVRFTRGRHTVKVATRTIRRRGSRGQFVVFLRPGAAGLLRVRATHGRTHRLSAMRARSAVQVIVPHAGGGAHGLRVRFLQAKLRGMHYSTGVNGYYSEFTRRAVLAYRKVNGMRRTFSANPKIFRRLAQGRGGFRPRYPGHGRHVEADLSHQVIALIYPGGHVYRVFPISSGKPSTPTVLGHYHFYSKAPGYNSEGMYYSAYWHGGYAVHGFSPSPTYPASHGCLRLPIINAKFVYYWVNIGDPIDVYYR